MSLVPPATILEIQPGIDSRHRPVLVVVVAFTYALPPKALFSMDSSPTTSNSKEACSYSPESTTAVISLDLENAAEVVKWDMARKPIIVIIGILLVLNSTLGSSLASGAVDFIRNDFYVANDELILLNSLYLLGYVFGPLLFSPLSETIGRKPVLQASFLGFTVFSLASALAPSWPSLFAFRFLCRISASAPLSVVGGLYADIFDDPVYRGRIVAVLIGITPAIRPVISGFIALILAAICCPALLFLPKTFGPILLKRKAQRIRRSNPSMQIRVPAELQRKTTRDMIFVTLLRPYAIFYILFVAYPIIFQGSAAVLQSDTTLTSMQPVGVGALIACYISVLYDSVLRRAKEHRKPWANNEEYRKLPLACIGGPLHVIVPTLSGVPFGIGIELTFISILNYMTDAYGIYAASAMASSTFTRSLFAVLLPLGTDKLYARLGIAWGCSLLGFLSLSLALTPFVLIRYGNVIRKKSNLALSIAVTVTMVDYTLEARP
ncbi:MFS transporter [Xylariaceae sp. FL1272]|nr:MFS transporter [Xylariaceae sp. FL1272]